MRGWQELLGATAPDSVSVESVLEALSEIPWFSNVGQPIRESDGAAPVADWNEARSIFDDLDNERYGPNGHLIRAVDALAPVFERPDLRLRWQEARHLAVDFVAYSAFIPEWMASVETSTMRTMEAEISEYLYEFVSFLLAEVIGGSRVRSTYFRQMLEWFHAGHFPCGWAGDWPAGRMRVY